MALRDRLRAEAAATGLVEIQIVRVPPQKFDLTTAAVVAANEQPR